MARRTARAAKRGDRTYRYKRKLMLWRLGIKVVEV